ncbi:MAG: putative Fe-S cluster assembly protein SufT [Oligoflexia bacterium]|nr:putative Fe-S cluster assembly protein SufT [Oligoflexia bacterium]
MLHEKVKLKRDTSAIQIPSGTVVTLALGTQVTITQSLGGSYTVISEDGFMARINAENADALGKQPSDIKTSATDKTQEQVGPLTQTQIEEKVWEQLKTCYDPEIPVNVVELGLVYECKVTAIDDGFDVAVVMTLTAPGCGMGPVLAGEIESKVRDIPGVKTTHVDVVFDPVWEQSMMSEAAKLQLGFF